MHIYDNYVHSFFYSFPFAQTPIAICSKNALFIIQFKCPLPHLRFKRGQLKQHDVMQPEQLLSSYNVALCWHTVVDHVQHI